MELSNKTARQLYAEIKEKPTRARFGFGRKPALVNVDLQKAYTAVGEFVTAYETDTKQLAYINQVAELARAKRLPVVWTYVAYGLGRGLRRLGYALQHAGFVAKHQGRLTPIAV